MIMIKDNKTNHCSSSPIRPSSSAILSDEDIRIICEKDEDDENRWTRDNDISENWKECKKILKEMGF